MIRPILNEDDIANIVVVLRIPALDGETMSYNVEILKGEMPAISGPSALFIDVVGQPLTPVSITGGGDGGRLRMRKREPDL